MRGAIDCVPSSWVTYNPFTGRCECRFMQPPYSTEDSELLDSLVKEQCSAPESWPVYPITLKGHATTYNDAMSRLKILSTKEFVYTEDGTLPQNKADVVKKAYQRIKVRGDKATAEQLMLVQPINTSDNECSTSNIHSSPEMSEMNSQNKNIVEMKNKHRKHNYISETDSSDENSNSINQPRRKPKQKSRIIKPIKESTQFSPNKDQVNETPKGSSNNHSSKKYGSKSSAPKGSSNNHSSKKYGSKSSASLTRDAQSSSPAPVDSGTNFAANRKPKVKSQNGHGLETVAETSKTPVSCQSPKNDKITIGSFSSKRFLPARSNSEPNANDCNQLNGLRYDMKLLIASVQELSRIVQGSLLAKDAHGANVQSFTTQYNVQFPLTTLEDFDAFDKKLRADEKLSKDFAATLHFVFDYDTTLAKNIAALLKKYISRDVALTFNAVKAGKDKRIFKDTQLCDIMRDVVLLKCKEGAQGSKTPRVVEQTFYRELGHCLSNAIDWYGQRKIRGKKTTKATKSITNSVAQAVYPSSHSSTSTESLVQSNKPSEVFTQ